MSLVRCHIKHVSEPRLGFVQFRILANIERGIDNAKVISDLHGVSQAAISKTVEGLVGEGLMSRHINQNDRRCVKLGLTSKGRKIVNSIKLDASKSFEDNLNLLNENEKRKLICALECLESFFVKIQESKT